MKIALNLLFSLPGVANKLVQKLEQQLQSQFRGDMLPLVMPFSEYWLVIMS